MAIYGFISNLKESLEAMELLHKLFIYNLQKKSLKPHKVSKNIIH